MAEETSPKPAEESVAAVTAARQRRKRKWDQPAEPLLSASVCVTGTFPLGMEGIVGMQLPGTLPLPTSAVVSNPVPANPAPTSLLLQPSSLSQNAAVLVQKLNLPKIQDELIAREIVINDAEPTVRYKLTKRLAQEEIQRCTGAVVITRGKYRPPNALPDSERPLYLHISAGSHLKDTAERIKAVDHAASMVEEILKQGQNSLPSTNAFHSAMSNGQATQPLGTCLFLGFQTDPSLNIAARIRGPNDQYINHIMNETGATVVLRGQGSGNLENSSVEETQQPLHLYLSSTNPMSLEAARNLAENLLDTISTECGTSRISSAKAYTAVPPPQQLLVGVQSSGVVLGVNANGVISLPCTTNVEIAPNGSISTSAAPPGTVLQPNMANYSYPSVSGGTCYSGYGGIYPQATPLQQVALALRKATAAGSPGLASTASAVSMPPSPPSSSTVETQKRPMQRRKFQELPVASKESTMHDQIYLQGSRCLRAGLEDSSVGNNVTSMPPPKKLVQLRSNEMPRNMPPPPKFSTPKSPPPPPPKFSVPGSPPPLQKFAAPKSPPQIEKDKGPMLKKSSTKPISDTLLKLVEYGEEEDDDTDDLGENSVESNLAQKPSNIKPFWAV